MLDILAQFDILGLGTLVGSVLFLAGLLWVLVDNRSFERLDQGHRAPEELEIRPRSAAVALTPRPDLSAAPDAPDPHGGSPGRPARPRRAA